ncbi:MAG: hypothetical protein JXB49_24535 [Bacteroidales bacterium]|nr:hypothetical protein [Bacteroidales bacterium]
MKNPNIEILEAAVDRVLTIKEEIVFVGGCATGLLVTDPAASPVGLTSDVDVIVEVTTLAEYYLLSEKLRKLGFTEDTSEDAPLCRWKASDVILDVMPTEPKILGFGNRWFKPAYNASEWTTLPSGNKIRLLPATYFLATKLEAFNSRGENDYLTSRDMEDVISVLDGRSEVIDEVNDAAKELKEYLASRFSELLYDRNFLEALPGFLRPDAASQARHDLVIARMKKIARHH